MSGNIGRTAHSSGCLIGGYNNIASNDTKSNPIYTIGSSYIPTDTALSNMYGLGYSHSNFWGSGKVSGWGAYVSTGGSFVSVIGDGIWTSGNLNGASLFLTGAINLNSSTGTAGQVLQSNGSSAATWSSNLTANSYNLNTPATGTGTGEIVYFGTGSSLTAGSMYYYSSSGGWVIANANSSSSSTGMLGIALGTTVSAGMLIRGFSKFSAYSLTTTGGILFINTSNGLFTETAPSTTTNIVRIIGYCVDVTNKIIYFNPDATWVEIA